MKLNDNLIEVYSKYCDIADEQGENIAKFKEVLNDAFDAINEHLGFNFQFEIGEFGPVNYNSLININDPISFYVKVYDSQIFDNTEKIANSKIKKSKIITTESLKLLFALYMENYFVELNTVLIARNHVKINSLNFLGFNVNIYIFASRVNDSIMLDSNNSSLAKANLEYFDNNIYTKAEETNYNYLRIVNVIKNIANKINVLNEPFLIESLIYNVPNKYFSGSLKEQLIKVINYLKFVNLAKFKSIFNEDLDLSKDLFVCSSLYSLIKKIDELIKNLR